MSDTTSIDSMSVGTDSSTYSHDGDAVSKLLAIAAASMDTDRDAAKACIQRAADLLRSCSFTDGTRAQGSSPVRGGLALWQKRRLAAYVAAHLSSSIRAADLAAVVGLSTGHFFRAFRMSFGDPPLVYVMRERMRRCQQLLLSSHAPLSEIALDCGMSDQSHLTRVFRRIVGVNPGVWRRQSKQQVASDDVTPNGDGGRPNLQRSK